MGDRPHESSKRRRAQRVSPKFRGTTGATGRPFPCAPPPSPLSAYSGKGEGQGRQKEYPTPPATHSLPGPASRGRSPPSYTGGIGRFSQLDLHSGFCRPSIGYENATPPHDIARPRRRGRPRGRCGHRRPPTFAQLDHWRTRRGYSTPPSRAAPGGRPRRRLRLGIVAAVALRLSPVAPIGLPEAPTEPRGGIFLALPRSPGCRDTREETNRKGGKRKTGKAPRWLALPNTRSPGLVSRGTVTSQI